jgi:hypothetical protein
MKKSTWIRSGEAVSTVKTSQAIMLAACWRTNSRHRGVAGSIPALAIS